MHPNLNSEVGPTPLSSPLQSPKVISLPTSDATPPSSPLQSPNLVAYTHASSPPSSCCPLSPSVSVSSQDDHILLTPSPDLPSGKTSKSSRHDYSSGKTPSTPSKTLYHPYIRPTAPTPQDEHKMTHLMGRLICDDGLGDMNTFDTKTREVFSRGVQRFSLEVLRRAARYKEAAREYQRYRVITSAWEIEQVSRLKEFLESMLEEQQQEAGAAMEEADLFTHMIVDRNAERAHQDLEYINAVHVKERAALDQLDSELDVLKHHATTSFFPPAYGPGRTSMEHNDTSQFAEDAEDNPSPVEESLMTRPIFSDI